MMMKGMLKRCLAGVAAAALAVTGMAAMTGAANAAQEIDGSQATQITVHNAQPGHTYTAYPFATFTFDHVDDNQNLIVTVDTNKAAEEGDWDWNSVINTAAGSPAGYQDNAAAYLAHLDGGGLRVLAENLKSALDEADSLPEPEGEPVAVGTEESIADKSITGLTAGTWYVVRDTYTDAEGRPQSGTIAIVATPIPGVGEGYDGKYYSTAVVGDSQGQALVDTVGEFYAKTVTSEGKPEKTGVLVDGQTEISVNGTKVNVGDIIKYTVTSTILVDGANDFWYIVDTAGKGLNILDDETVDGTEYNVEITDPATMTKYSDYTVDVAETAGQYTVTTIEIPNAAAWNGTTVTVTYYAQVTQDIIDTENLAGQNTVAAGHNSADLSDGDPVTVTTGTLAFHKHGVDADGKTDTGGALNMDLEGADFKIYSLGKTYTDANPDGEALKFTTAGVYTPNGDGSDVVSSNTEGMVSVSGLGEGYYLVEEQASDDLKDQGYDTTYLAKFVIHIDGEGTVTLYQNNGAPNDNHLASQATDQQVEVLNVKSFTQLPVTGAAGITMFVVLGLLIAGAGVTVYMKSRGVRNAMRA